eukprot:6564836-Heterocapsa_arctica.AAC.1
MENFGVPPGLAHCHSRNMVSCSAATAMAEWPREVIPQIRSQMCRTNNRSTGSSWARGPSERGNMEVWGGPS